MSALLELKDLSAGYGQSVVLRGIDLSLEAGRALAVLGRNGVGKTTLINTIVGLTRIRGGTVALEGRDITTMPAERRAAAGIGWVPQERNIFKSLTVEENVTAVARPGEWTLERVYGMFPRLKERRRNMGNQLSGGEQQMLAIGRALALNPRLLLLDEPFEGLAPIIVEEISAALAGIVKAGQSTIVVEQNARKVLSMTDDAVVLERGAIVLREDSKSLLADPERVEKLLSVAAA